MKIGILGSGDVAQTLAAGFLKHHYEVMVGTRTKEKLAEWNSKHKAKLGSFSEAAAFGDIIVLSIKGTVAKNALQLAGSQHLKGKIIIDTTNPIADAPPENGVLKFFTTYDQSLLEQLQESVPEAHFVKAWNSIGSTFMVSPTFSEGKPSMFICGNNEKAKLQVKKIVEQFGFSVEDMGSAASARAIEPLCMLWCIPGFLHNDWSHAFKLLKK